MKDERRGNGLHFFAAVITYRQINDVFAHVFKSGAFLFDFCISNRFPLQIIESGQISVAVGCRISDFEPDVAGLQVKCGNIFLERIPEKRRDIFFACVFGGRLMSVGPAVYFACCV